MSEIDRRVHEDEIEIRSVEGGGRVISGYAAIFNSYSRDLGGFKEIIRPGAFAEALSRGGNVFSFWNHNRDALLGSTESGTLKLTENARGLKYDLEIPDTTHGRDLEAHVKRGVVKYNSFAFSNPKDTWSKNGKSRELHSVDLLEVSPVYDPAYMGAEIVSMRSMELHKQHQGYDPKRVKQRVEYLRLTSQK